MNQLQVYDACDLLTGQDECDLLGNGSFAKVRICHFPKRQQYVALKYFFHAGDQKKISDAENEAKILSRIEHKNILGIMGVTKWQHFFGIVTELLCCGDLEHLLSNDSCDISWELRTRFLFELADALKHLHCHDPTRSYIHGDVKPQNILLSDKLAIKLADFGAMFIAKTAGANSLSVSNNKNTQHTPLYTAPEYLRDPSLPKTPEMDVYGYAMCAYEILTRKRVFSDDKIGRLWSNVYCEDCRSKFAIS